MLIKLLSTLPCLHLIYICTMSYAYFYKYTLSTRDKYILFFKNLKHFCKPFDSTRAMLCLYLICKFEEEAFRVQWSNPYLIN